MVGWEEEDAADVDDADDDPAVATSFRGTGRASVVSVVVSVVVSSRLFRSALDFLLFFLGRLSPLNKSIPFFPMVDQNLVFGPLLRMTRSNKWHGIALDCCV